MPILASVIGLLHSQYILININIALDFATYTGCMEHELVKKKQLGESYSGQIGHYKHICTHGHLSAYDYFQFIKCGGCLKLKLSKEWKIRVKFFHHLKAIIIIWPKIGLCLYYFPQRIPTSISMSVNQPGRWKFEGQFKETNHNSFLISGDIFHWSYRFSLFN